VHQARYGLGLEGRKLTARSSDRVSCNFQGATDEMSNLEPPYAEAEGRSSRNRSVAR
jgi:hypothetical protein